MRRLAWLVVMIVIVCLFALHRRADAAAPTGSVVLDLQPAEANAIVTIDGKTIAGPFPREVHLPVGKHRIFASSEGWVGYEIVPMIAAGSHRAIHVQLTKKKDAPTPPPPVRPQEGDLGDQAPSSHEIPPPASLPMPQPWPPPLHPQPVDAHRAQVEWAAASALADGHFLVTATLALGPIAENPQHPSHLMAVARLAAIARELTEAANIERWFGAMTMQQIDALGINSPARGEALYLFGKHRYAEGLFDESIRALSSLPPNDPDYPKALLLAAGADVRLAKAVPAIEALQQALLSLDKASPSIDRAYFNQLALLSIARIYASAMTRLDESNAPTIDSSKLSAAVKFYEKMDPASPLWADAAFELGLLFGDAGDESHALSLARLLASSAFASEHAASAQLMKASIAFVNCDYAGVIAATTELRAKAVPLHAHLEAAISLAAGQRKDAFYTLLLAARDGRGIEADAATEIARSFGDRAIARRLTHLARIDTEVQALAKGGAPAMVRAALDEERARVVASVSTSVRLRVEAKRDELAAALENAKHVDTVIASKTVGLDPSLARSQITRQESERNIVKVWEPEIDAFIHRLPYATPRYTTQLFHVTVTSTCGR